MTEASERQSTGWFSTPWRIAGGALVVVIVVVVMVLLVEHDAAGQAPDADTSIANVLKQDGYLVGFALIYIEETGVPLFIPGDAFLAYVGHRLPHNVPVFLVAWIGFVLAVTFGAQTSICCRAATAGGSWSTGWRACSTLPRSGWTPRSTRFGGGDHGP